jgi:2-oxoisovalerate dehydrogenase E2 component (dihydrolipoyl transacylase)
MARFVMRLPDLGEGTVSAEVIAWKTRVGEVIAEDAPLVEMSTEKAVVEVPSPVSGRVVALTGQPGDVVAVGAELAVFETDGAASGASLADPAPALASTPAPVVAAAAVTPESTPAARAAVAPSAILSAPPRSLAISRAQASPAVRRKAFECGLDLSSIVGSGPGGRILDEDLERARAGTPGVEEIPVIGIRRVIAQRMAEAKRVAPHFAYIEEVDVTALEALRLRLGGASKLTYLPFITRALALVLREFPQCNAHYDEKRNVIRRYADVHAGIATQTADGLKVPVVRNVLDHDLESLSAELRRVSEAAREGSARREELSGSTITITSLGKLGGIAATPILNLPEVAIIGINKAIERVVVQDGKMVIRRMMNLSSSFDHRFVDGFDAAAMIQALKVKLEQPESIFE